MVIYKYLIFDIINFVKTTIKKLLFENNFKMLATRMAYVQSR